MVAGLTGTAVVVAAVIATQSIERRTEHADGSGPLQAHSAPGAVSVYAPEKASWSGTFGSYVLCSTSGADIEIEKIRYRTPVKPVSITPQLRTVSKELRTSNPGIGYLGSSLGTPPNLPERKLPGTYQDATSGTHIRQSCAQENVEGTGFSELLFVLNLDKRGGIIDRVWIDYRVEDSLYTLRIDFQMVACGTHAAKVAMAGSCNEEAQVT